MKSDLSKISIKDAFILPPIDKGDLLNEEDEQEGIGPPHLPQRQRVASDRRDGKRDEDARR